MINIATKIYTEEDVILQDDAETVVTLKPLPIRTLRRFMAKLEDLQTVKKEVDAMSVLFDLATICIEKQVPKLIEDETLEDVLDMPTIYKIIEVCGGVKLNDPNLMAAATSMMESQSGKN